MSNILVIPITTIAQFSALNIKQRHIWIRKNTGQEYKKQPINQWVYIIQPEGDLGVRFKKDRHHHITRTEVYDGKTCHELYLSEITK